MKVSRTYRAVLSTLRNIVYRAAGSWNFNKQHEEHFWRIRGSENRSYSRTPWCRFYRGLHRKLTRSDARQVVRTYTCTNASQKRAESQEDRIEPAAVNMYHSQDRTRCTQHLRTQHLEICCLETNARQHGKWVKYSRKGAEILKNSTQETGDRQEVFRAHNPSSWGKCGPLWRSGILYRLYI